MLCHLPVQNEFSPRVDRILHMQARSTPLAPKGLEAVSLYALAHANPHRHDFVVPVKAVAEKVKEPQQQL